MRFGYQAPEIVVLESIDIIANSVSIITSIFITIIFFKFKELQTFPFRLIIILINICQIFSCSRVFFQFIPNQGQEFSGQCTAQGLVTSFGALATANMTVVISVCTYLAICHRISIKDLQNKYYIKFILAALLISFLLALGGFLDHDFGPTGSTCWINHKKKKRLEMLVRRLLLFYIWLWLTVIINIVLFYLIYKSLKNHLSEIQEQNSVNVSLQLNVKKVKKSLQVYPFTIAFCWLFDTVLIVVEAIEPRAFDTHFQINIFKQLFLGLQGFFLSLIFCKNEQVRAIIRREVFKTEDNNQSQAKSGLSESLTESDLAKSSESNNSSQQQQQQGKKQRIKRKLKKIISSSKNDNNNNQNQNVNSNNNAVRQVTVMEYEDSFISDDYSERSSMENSQISQYNQNKEEPVRIIKFDQSYNSKEQNKMLNSQMKKSKKKKGDIESKLQDIDL